MLHSLIPSPKNVLLAIGCVLIFAFLVYCPSLNNDFVNWDDDVHLLRNPFVHSLDARHLRDIFTTTVNKIYIPLTSLSFAIEYHFFGESSCAETVRLIYNHTGYQRHHRH